MGAHPAVVDVRVQTEDALVVAVEGQPHPVPLLVRGGLVNVDVDAALGLLGPCATVGQRSELFEHAGRT